MSRPGPTLSADGRYVASLQAELAQLERRTACQQVEIEALITCCAQAQAAAIAAHQTIARLRARRLTVRRRRAVLLRAVRRGIWRRRRQRWLPWLVSATALALVFAAESLFPLP